MHGWKNWFPSFDFAMLPGFHISNFLTIMPYVMNGRPQWIFIIS